MNPSMVVNPYRLDLAAILIHIHRLLNRLLLLFNGTTLLVQINGSGYRPRYLDVLNRLLEKGA